MHKRLEEYLNKLEAEKHIKKEKEKNDFLINNGLFEKEYSESGYSDEFCHYDHTNNKYYKQVGIECSDEDYDKIMSLSEQKAKYNKTGMLLIAIAVVIYAIGFILGLCSYDEYVGAVPMIMIWLITFLLGTTVYVFAEIIRLLDIIAKK